MNPIELVWHEMKVYSRKKPSRTIEDLVYRIQKFFHYKLTPEKCSQYINRLKEVMKIVIERDGDWSDC